MRDWLPAAQQAAEPHRTAILTAAINLWCTQAEARAHLPELQHTLNEEETRVADQPAGPVIDSLGITLDLAPGDLISDAIVIAKVIGEDGIPSISISENDSLDWLNQYALIKAAERIIDSQQFTTTGDE